MLLCWISRTNPFVKTIDWSLTAAQATTGTWPTGVDTSHAKANGSMLPFLSCHAP